ncbi:uncharacterized protein LOC143235665 [Tachypleus tridentatus]|uniref:uncharacterized protein LOC143235665 n=1 Tax=Tachypleus tridentatus TaxID=6853 RepID=UPI003FD335BB
MHSKNRVASDTSNSVQPHNITSPSSLEGKENHQAQNTFLGKIRKTFQDITFKKPRVRKPPPSKQELDRAISARIRHIHKTPSLEWDYQSSQPLLTTVDNDPKHHTYPSDMPLEDAPSPPRP